MIPAPSSLPTKVRAFDVAAISEAAALIRAGLPVVIATETVYGLAARADSNEAIAGIYAAKGRPAFNPLIVHVTDIAQAESLARFDDPARTLAAAFWPGPLTLVLPKRERSPISSLAMAGLPTIALRSPRHAAMRALIDATGLPLAAPSANRSGRMSPTRAEHVLASLDGRIPLVIDAGPTEFGLESTIVGCNDGRLTILRPGPISAEEIERVTGLAVGTWAGGEVIAPGQTSSHYAPGKPLRLNAVDHHEGEWLIGFGDVTGDATLSATGDLTEAAARLFDRLHEADASERDRIAIAPVPETGLGIAINDRLKRAAMPA